MGEHRRPRQPASTIPARRALKEGLVLGLVFAALYSAFAIALFSLRGSVPFDHHGTSLGAVLLTYVGCGIAAGGVFGLSYRIRQLLVGQFVVGVVLAMIVFFGISIGADGLHSALSRASLQRVFELGLLFGIPITVGMRSILRT